MQFNNLTCKQKEFFVEAYRRFVINGRGDLASLWCGLGSNSYCTSMIKDGYMEWVKLKPPVVRTLGWLRFTQKGIDTFKGILPELDELLKGSTYLAFIIEFNKDGTHSFIDACGRNVDYHAYIPKNEKSC